MNSTNSRRLSSSGLDTNALGGELDVILCNRQGTRLNVYSQGFPKSSSKTSFIYYTLTLTFSQSLYSPTPKSVVPVYVVEMNSTTRTYPKSGQSLQSTMYYDYDISLSGSFHPSQLLTTQLMGKDTFLTILPHSTNGNFGGTLLSMSLYDRVLV